MPISREVKCWPARSTVSPRARSLPAKAMNCPDVAARRISISVLPSDWRASVCSIIITASAPRGTIPPVAIRVAPPDLTGRRGSTLGYAVAPAARLFRHRVARHHAAGHVIRDMAMEQPGADIVGYHINNLAGGRQHLGGVDALTVMEHGIAVPMRGMDVVLVAEPGDVPAHMLAAAHGQAREIAVEQAVDRVLLVALDEPGAFLPDGGRN